MFEFMAAVGEGETKSRVARLHKDWVVAAEALQSETVARRKAEALRQVVQRIVVAFRPSGKRCPLGYVEKIEVVPLENSGTEGGFRSCLSAYPKKSNPTNTASG